jgi:hypothetical protein
MRYLIIILASLMFGGCVANPYNYTYRECERINSNFSDIAKCVEHARINRPNASSDPDRAYFENFVQDLARKVDTKQMSDYSAREYVRAKIFELDKQRYENALVRKKIEDEERARRDVEDRRRAEIQNAERIRMQQEYQRIKPVIDKEWCSSWASVGDDRCFWDKAGANRSGNNQNTVIIQQPQKNTGYPFPLSTSYNSGQNKICIYKNSFGESKALTLQIFETCPSMY